MKIALVIDRAMMGGVTVINALLYDQLKGRGHDVTLFISSADSGNGVDFLREKKIAFREPCKDVRSLRRRCSALRSALMPFESVIFSESAEAQYIVSSLPQAVVVIKWIHNPYEVIENRNCLFNTECLDVLVPVSPWLRELLMVKRYNGTVSVVPNATDVSFRAPKEAEVQNPLQIVYIGRLHQLNKNIFILPQIASVLKQRNVIAEWTVIGDGADAGELKNKFAKTGVPVRFPGVMSRSEVEQILAKSDFSIISSKFDAFGLNLVEAMSSGCIPVCANLTVFSWILGNRSEDLQVVDNGPAEYADIICGLLQEPDRAARIRRNLLARQQKYFSPEVMGTTFNNLIMGASAAGGATTRSGRIRIPWRERVKDSVAGRWLHYIWMILKQRGLGS